MVGVYNCERCGALRHKAAICRAPSAFTGACGTCGAYAHVSRQCPAARMHTIVITAGPPAMLWPPPTFVGPVGVGVPRPGG